MLAFNVYAVRGLQDTIDRAVWLSRHHAAVTPAALEDVFRRMGGTSMELAAINHIQQAANVILAAERIKAQRQAPTTPPATTATAASAQAGDTSQTTKTRTANAKAAARTATRGRGEGVT